MQTKSLLLESFCKTSKSLLIAHDSDKQQSIKNWNKNHNALHHKKNYERVRYKHGERYVSLTQQKLYDMPWRNCNPNWNAQNNCFRNVQTNFKIIMKM